MGNYTAWELFYTQHRLNAFQILNVQINPRLILLAKVQGVLKIECIVKHLQCKKRGKW